MGLCAKKATCYTDGTFACLPDNQCDRVIKKDLPVLIGHNYEHVMARAVIKQTAKKNLPCGDSAPEKVEIIIVSEGPEAQSLGDFVAAGEIVALSFGGVPVRPNIKKE